MNAQNQQIFAHIQHLTSLPLDESKYMDIWLFSEEMDRTFVEEVIVPHCLASPHFMAFTDRVLLAPFDEEVMDGGPHDFTHPRCLLANNVSIFDIDLETLPERFLDSPYLKNLYELFLDIDWNTARGARAWEYLMQWEGLKTLPLLILGGPLTEDQKAEVLALAQEVRFRD